jgi:hypothetical protein
MRAGVNGFWGVCFLGGRWGAGGGPGGKACYVETFAYPGQPVSRRGGRASAGKFEVSSRVSFDSDSPPRGHQHGERQGCRECGGGHQERRAHRLCHECGDEGEGSATAIAWLTCHGRPETEIQADGSKPEAAGLSVLTGRGQTNSFFAVQWPERREWRRPMEANPSRPLSAQ